MTFLTNKIIDDCFDKLFQNLGTALRISLPPLLGALIVALLINFQLILRFINSGAEAMLSIDGTDVLLAVLGVFLIVAAGFYVAVRWHRFAFGLEGGGGAKTTASYALKSILLGILAALAMVILIGLPSLVFTTNISIEVGAYEEAIARGPLHVLIDFLGTTLYAYVLLRLAPVLVGEALRQELNRPAFAQTKQVSGQIAQIAIIYAAATLLWSLLGLAGLPLPLAIVIDLVLSWIAFMLSISILTEIHRTTFEPRGEHQAAA